MKVGMVGCGKLGLPVATAIDFKGHEVWAYDANPNRMSKNVTDIQETGPEGTGNFLEYLKNSKIKFANLPDLCENAELIFVAVQTPHGPKFEGITPLPTEREDFDYSYLKSAIKSISLNVKSPVVVAIVSTVLPGTIRREILPLCNEHMKLVYCPSFIAMGTTMNDYLYPELVLCGVHDEEAAKVLEQFYKTITDAPFYKCKVEEAELIKVAYNTFIGQKIVFINTMMEICHKMDLNVDVISDALKLSTKRLISPAYLRGGMSDAGACHPRDNIALSWLSRKLSLSYDLFDSIMTCRERHCRWLADMMIDCIDTYMVPGVSRPLGLHILGIAYKPGSNLIYGSSALLVREILKEKDYEVTYNDPYVGCGVVPESPKVFLIGINHPEFPQYTFPSGSVIIDPFRYIPDQKYVKVIRIGEGMG